MSEVQFPERYLPLLEPHDYKIAWSGRGAGKSCTFADALVNLAAERPERVLCTREFQHTIRDSVHKGLVDAITKCGLGGAYEVTEKSIRSRCGSEFIFAGLHANIAQIKSLVGITKTWVEEAETVSADSWRVLVPTVMRTPTSEIWISFNPRYETDATYQRFIINRREYPNAFFLEDSWRNNRWFPALLRVEMERDWRVDPEAAAWIWDGQCRKISKAQILAGKWRKESFEIPHPRFVSDVKNRQGNVVHKAGDINYYAPVERWDGPWYGLDFGFANDPLSAHEYWGKGNTLYVRRELYTTGLNLDKIAPTLVRTFPGLGRRVVRADNSRPETINHLTGNGINCVAASKWAGSVEDGIEYLRGLESIVVHPDCPEFVKECQLYSWKVDKVTGDVVPIPVDRWNHAIDDCRYALDPAIKMCDRQVQFVHQEHVSIAPELDEIEDLQPQFVTF